MIGNGIGIFAGLIESQTQDPYPILHLSYPEAVTFKGIRSETRVAVNESITVTNLNQKMRPAIAGVMADISIVGARIELMEGMAEIGDRLELSALVDIRDLKKELILCGEVRSRVDPADDISDDTLVGYGLEFSGQSDEQRLITYAYIFNQIVLQDQYPA